MVIQQLFLSSNWHSARPTLTNGNLATQTQMQTEPKVFRKHLESGLWFTKLVYLGVYLDFSKSFKKRKRCHHKGMLCKQKQQSQFYKTKKNVYYDSLISLHDSERGSQPVYSWRLGLLRSPCCGSPAGSSDGGPDVRTHAHRVFFSPGLWYFRGTPTQSLSIPPLQYNEQTYKPLLHLKWVGKSLNARRTHANAYSHQRKTHLLRYSVRRNGVSNGVSTNFLRERYNAHRQIAPGITCISAWDSDVSTFHTQSQ